MREIKFRAWDKRKKEFNHSPFLKTGDDKNDWIVFLNQQDQPREKGDLVFKLPYSRQQFELCQYTSLHDKNGKEIYEGDILSYPTHKGYYLIQWLYEDEECGFSCERDKPSYNYMLPVVWKKMKVIGNIYENPELLKGGVENG